MAIAGVEGNHGAFNYFRKKLSIGTVGSLNSSEIAFDLRAIVRSRRSEETAGDRAKWHQSDRELVKKIGIPLVFRSFNRPFGNDIDKDILG
jgi:hypothetical protein